MRELAIVLAMTTALAGCAADGLSVEAGDVPVVPVDTVVEKLKCGLSRALEADTHGYAGLRHSTAKVHLAVNVVRGRKFDASASTTAGIPVFGSAGTILPSLSFSSASTRTINSFIDFDVVLNRGDVSRCGAVNAPGDAGFETWMSEIVGALNRMSHADPKAIMQGYEYQSDFTLVRSGGGSLGVTIAPVKVTSSASASRSDIQNLKITIAAVHLDAKTGKVKGGAVPSFVKPTIQSLPDRSHGNFFLQ